MKKVILLLSLLALAGNSTECMLRNVAKKIGTNLFKTQQRSNQTIVQHEHTIKVPWKTLLLGGGGGYWYWNRNKDLTLIKRVKQGDLEGVNGALANGANINNWRMPYFNPLLATSPLHAAVFSGDIEMIKHLLAKPDLSRESIVLMRLNLEQIAKLSEANNNWESVNNPQEEPSIVEKMTKLWHGKSEEELQYDAAKTEYKKSKEKLSEILTLLRKAEESKTKQNK